MSVYSNSETVRAGQLVRVLIYGASAGGVGSALREAQRHVRVVSFLGALGGAIQGPRATASGLQGAVIAGTTFRAAGSEYTAGQLRTAIASAYTRGGGVGSVSVTVESIDDGALRMILQALDLFDPRVGGSAGAVAAHVGSSAVDATTGVLEGTADLAAGVGGAASGLGEGLKEIGGAARDWPRITTAVVVVVGAAVLARYLRLI